MSLEGNSTLNSLRDLGLNDKEIDALADEVEHQLLDSSRAEIQEVLCQLNADKFLSRVDVALVASHVGLKPRVAQAAVILLACQISEMSELNGPNLVSSN